ncbi:FadR/GntR family transcriptional regulator [Gemmiger sp.]|uniref:FadR/GntR family transcriptional regulator n=1 Tax=Gemmiger sp. TaxID=2049027 RepID=UPI003EFE403A
MAGKGKVKSGIVKYLCKNIQEGTWKVGDRIPSENQLCQELGVSRVSVRSALQQLSTFGVVESVHGKGTFLISDDLTVFETSPERIPSENSLTEMEQMQEFRAMIEPSICAKVAPEASPELIARLDALLKTMRDSVGKSKEFVNADMQFHLEICYACKNPVITEVMADVFRKKSDSCLLYNLSNGFYGGIYYHTMLLDALRKHDEKRARSIMKEHLERGIEDLYTDAAMPVSQGNEE